MEYVVPEIVKGKEFIDDIGLFATRWGYYIQVEKIYREG